MNAVCTDYEEHSIDWSNRESQCLFAVYIYINPFGRNWKYRKEIDKTKLVSSWVVTCMKTFHRRYICFTMSRRQFPVIQNILLQQENHSRDITTMTRDVLNVQIGVNDSVTHIHVHQQSLSPCILRSRVLSKIRKASYAMLVVAGKPTQIIFLLNLDSVWE